MTSIPLPAVTETKETSNVKMNFVHWTNLDILYGTFSISYTKTDLYIFCSKQYCWKIIP